MQLLKITRMHKSVEWRREDVDAHDVELMQEQSPVRVKADHLFARKHCH